MKINIVKLELYLLNSNNGKQMKKLVRKMIEEFLKGPLNTQNEQFLKDLGILEQK